jgi:hypothetical protein
MEMTEDRASKLYDQYIRLMPLPEKLRLLALLASDLTTEAAWGEERPEHDIMELDGLGKELRDGIDAQAYVRRLRAGETLP